MELMLTPSGLLTLAMLVGMFLYFSETLTLGAVSLPCITALTSGIYFYIMPSLSMAGGNYEFFGMFLTSLEWPHFAVLLYMTGVAAACYVFRRYLFADPSVPQGRERQLNLVVLLLLWAVALSGAATLVALGKVNMFADETFSFSESRNLLFLNMSFSMMLPLTLMVLVRDDFGPRSLALLAVILLVLVQTGFRFRIMILLCAVVSAYALARRIKMRALYVVPGTILALVFVNAFGMSRKYGNGITLSNIQGMSWEEILVGFGGEVGPVYTFASFASNPLPDLIYFDPWIIGIARMVPSDIWPDKPSADYLLKINAAFTVSGIENAGVAATQHLEMLAQFGWFGVPFLSYIYFAIAIWLIGQLNKLGRETRIAGSAIIPAFFGFFMQQRGYFFMTFSEGLFMLGPLFLVHWGEKRLVRKRETGQSRPLVGSR
jgi:hypothetical protein